MRIGICERHFYRLIERLLIARRTLPKGAQHVERSQCDTVLIVDDQRVVEVVEQHPSADRYRCRMAVHLNLIVPGGKPPEE
ncbi:MAG: hypothetical protein MI923_03590 [Phycisphaerales bacterium]|nr:hypothetical protein [Phycisphaerales bacterium]